MRKFTPTRKSSPCPICDDISGKCRSHIDGEIYLCMVYGDAPLGEIVNGFKCVKTQYGGNWATFKLDNTAEWTQAQRQEWEQQKKARREQRERENALRKQRSLSVAERDRQYRTLPQEVSENHRICQLRRRGLRKDEYQYAIDRQWVKTWQPGQVAKGVSPLLPGVRQKDGQLKLCGVSGFAIAALNLDGQICAYQIASDDKQKFAKYIWLSSQSHGGMSPNLPNGELPLFIWKHPEATEIKWIIYTEGSIKSLIVALWYWIRDSRKNVLVVGASGGNFTSSSRQIKEIIDKFPDAKRHTLMPDAGAISNSNIIRNYQGLEQLLSIENKELTVGWWGQERKRFHKDIDELLTINEDMMINIISWQEFTKEFQLQSKEETAKTSSRKVAPFNQKSYPEQAKEEWRKSRQFTAKHILENPEGWLKWPVPKENTITFIRSGLGTGKTTQVIEWLIELINEPWRNLGYRNTLLLQFCAKTDKATEEKLGKKDGFQHLHEHNASLFILDPTGKISTCVHSILHFKPEDFDGCNLLLDETVSVIRTLFEDSNIRQHEQVLTLFAEAVRRAKRVICLDGLMNDWTVKYISALAPDKEVVTVKNIDNRPKPIVNFLEGTIDLDEEKVKKNDRSPWLELIFSHAQRPAIATDSQIMAEWLDEALSAEGYKVLRIDSKTVPEDYVKEFMEECDEYIERENPDVLIYTPSAESGLDVSIKSYFTHHIAFFFGVLSVDSYLQMLGRIRDNIPKFVWCREWVAKEESAESRSPFVSTLQKSLLSALELDITECFSQEAEDLKELISNRLNALVSQANNIHFQTSVQVKAIRNYERGNLRECLLEAIQAAGYPVRLCTLKSNEEFKTKNQDGTEIVKRRNCHDIFTAEKIAVNDADFGGNFDATWEERVKTIQANYRKQLPGIEETSSWTEDFIYKIRYENPKFITHNRRYWLFKNSAVALRIQQERWNWIFHQEEISLAKVRSERALIEALRKVGLEEVIDSNGEWTESDSTIQRITEACKKPEIANALGRHPGKTNPIQWVGRLVRMLGLEFKGTQQRQEGDRVRTYRVMGLADPDRLNAMACLTRKYEKYSAFEVEELHWDETLATQGFEGVTPPPENVYKLGMRCDSNSNELKARGEMKSTGEAAVGSSKPETLTTQGFEGVTPPPENVYKLGMRCDSNDELKARGEMSGTGEAAVASELDEAEATFATCETFPDFVTAAAKYDAQTIDRAIGLQPLSIRSRLEKWQKDIQADIEGSADIIRSSLDGGTPHDAAIAYHVMKALEVYYKLIWSQIKARIWAMVPGAVKEPFRVLLNQAKEMGLIDISEVA